MNESKSTQTAATDRTLRIAVWLALAGLVLLLLFMVVGFAPWSVGLGLFLGMPLVLLAIVLYVVAVIRDLRRREAL